ncbi:MAG: AmmeMemoRadiSam system protein B [Patescibacteria group bacterium]|nr:AmmeMemoRadiSam system protein B [Patescibacteria group bacterium]
MALIAQNLGKANNQASGSQVKGERLVALASGFSDIAQPLERLMASTKPAVYQNGTQQAAAMVQIGITSHHLPTAAPLIASFYATLQSRSGPRQVFVIVGPDHLERCNQYASTTQLPYQTPFGLLPVDQAITEDLIKAGVNIDNNCFEGEHAIGTQAIFIKREFPEALIVPLLLSSATTDSIIEKIVGVLKNYSEEITVIGSIDFSHALNYEQALRVDSESDKMIAGLESLGLTLFHTDSPPTVSLLVGLAKVLGSAKADIFQRANSFDFNGQKENTTGYRNIFFEGESQP